MAGIPPEEHVQAAQARKAADTTSTTTSDAEGGDHA